MSERKHDADCVRREDHLPTSLCTCAMTDAEVAADRCGYYRVVIALARARVQWVRGMCTDEEPHHLIDQELVRVLDILDGREAT